jgi:hypothetical protein
MFCIVSGVMSVTSLSVPAGCAIFRHTFSKPVSTSKPGRRSPMIASAPFRRTVSDYLLVKAPFDRTVFRSYDGLPFHNPVREELPTNRSESLGACFMELPTPQ